MTAILLLGGTQEARDLSVHLASAGADFATQLASSADDGHVGRVRRGGFGSAEAMAAYLREEKVAMVVDATDPFAAVVSPMARRAAKDAGVRYFRVERRPWRRSAGDRWTDVRTLEEAAERLDNGARVFLALGPGELGPFLHRRDLSLVLATAAPPDIGHRHDVVVERLRGPLSVDSARDIFARHDVQALVAKNSGDDEGAALLVAARERRTHVLMVKRPRGQPWPSARDAAQAIRRLRRFLPR